MKTKICTKCKKNTPISNFYRDSRSLSGVQSKCISCDKAYKRKNSKKIYENNARYVANNPWIKTLSHIIARCSNKKHYGYKYYGGRGIKCLITLEELKQLWFRDKAYEMKKPSIDRIDSKGNYTFSNCRYMELSENISKRNKEHISRGVMA